MVPRARSISPQHRYNGGTLAAARGSRTPRDTGREMENGIAGPRDSADQNKTFRTAAVARASPPPLLLSPFLVAGYTEISRNSACSITLIRVVGAKYHVESTTNERASERMNECTYERMNQRTNRHLLFLSHVVIVSLSAIFLFGTLSPSDSTPLLRLPLLLFPPSSSFSRLGEQRDSRCGLAHARRSALSRDPSATSRCRAVARSTILTSLLASMSGGKTIGDDEREFTQDSSSLVSLSDSVSSSVLGPLFLRPCVDLSLSFSLSASFTFAVNHSRKGVRLFIGAYRLITCRGVS